MHGVLKLRVIVITGTPGVGKTTISKALATKLRALYLSVGDLVKTENLILGVDVERQTLIADLKKLRERINSIIFSSSQDVIVDGHYASDVTSRNLVSYAFVLRRDPDDLKIKLKEKGFKELKILENVTSELLDVCLIDTVNNYGTELVNEIDVSFMTIDGVINEILTILKGKKTVKVENVDWLSKLEKNGRLGKLLNQIGKL
ncbi:adenylate kinase [Candidatus Bathyarchaeota archaeon]|nr:MAG: adenylate kinase [Candidatus Bathyarchaeota archaeon]